MANYYPPVGFAFSVSLVGSRLDVDSSFCEVGGLSTEMATTELREGGENRFVHKLPGAIRNSNVVLKRGLMVSQSLFFSWSKATLESGLAYPIETKTILIILQDEHASPLIQWTLSNCWPVKWSVGDFLATENKVAIDTMEFAYTRLTRRVVAPRTSTGMFNT